MRRSLVIVLASGALVPGPRAQDPVLRSIVSASPAVPNAAEGFAKLAGRSLPSLSFELDEPIYDEPSSGEIWARNRDLKVGFTAKGARVVPLLGAAAPRSWPVEVALRAVRVGGRSLRSDAHPPRRDGDVVDLDRGVCTERWHVRARDLEQTFVFESLPARGALELEVELATDLRIEPVADGFALRGPDGGLHHGRAFAVDAKGRRLELQSELVAAGTRVVHRVPAGFVAEATLPLVVDPLIRTLTMTPGLAGPAAAPDVAFDPVSRRVCVVWEYPASATDTDVYSELVGEDGTPVAGSIRAVDLTLDDWREPSIAADAFAGVFLIACQARAAAGGWAIQGRLRDGTQSTGQGSPFRISGAEPGDKSSPAVGGNGSRTQPGPFAVAWQRTLGPSGPDLFYQCVDASSALRFPASQPLDVSGAVDSAPRISKSCGFRDEATQRWMVVWSREYLPTDHDVYGALIARDGSLARGTFAIDTGGADDTRPDVSSPTDPIRGTRYHLIAYERQGVSSYVMTALHDGAGVVQFAPLWSVLNTTSTVTQSRPRVDSNGCRFAIAYEQLWSSGSPSDHDVYLAGLHVENLATPRLGVSDSPVFLASSYWWEGRSAITSLGEADPPRWAAICEDSNNGGSPKLVGAIYQGTTLAPNVQRLPHGCDGLQLDVTGAPYLGARVTLSVPGAGTGPFYTKGIVFGLPFTTPIPICGSCLLGVDGPAYLPTIHLDIPCEGAMLGLTVAGQGYDRIGGRCFGTIRFSDTVLLTVR